MILRFGEEQVNEWRISACVRPPAISPENHLRDQSDPKYARIGKENIPLTESLVDTEKRALVYWKEQIVPDLTDNHHVIISAHGNTLRALVKCLDNIPDENAAPFQKGMGTSFANKR